MTDTGFHEGSINFSKPAIEGPCHTYYKAFGDISSTGPTPLVVLHGGPGVGHDYCLPFGKLWSLYGIPVIFYDQVGCARSTHFPDKLGDTSFWTFDLFVAELDNLLAHFRLDNVDGPGYDILGHSWGGRVAADFASRQPPGLRKLILMGAAASSELFCHGLLTLKKQLSAASDKAIDEAIKNQNFIGPAYQAAHLEFCKRFLCRADPWPQELAVSNKHTTEDATVRISVQGVSPWSYGGLLKDYSSIPLLPRIKATTMLLNGEYDTAQYESNQPFFEHIPRVCWTTITNGSHMCFLDSAELQEKTLKVIGDFLVSDSWSGQQTRQML